MNVSKAYLKKEYEKAKESILTHVCDSDCDHRCGVCTKNQAKVIKADNNDFESIVPKPHRVPEPYEYVQTIFTYEKKGRAVYNSHIAVMRQFEMAFQRSGLDVLFTQGFNPKPKLEFLNPITMGVYGNNELLLCELPISQINESTVKRLNDVLAEGFVIKEMKLVPQDKTGRKISLSSKMRGSIYEIKDIRDNEIRTILDSRLNDESNDYVIKKASDGVFNVTINGDKNIFKLLFPKEMSKFHIAGSCTMTRLGIFMEEI